MGFTIKVGETRPVLDQDGQPVASSTQTGLPFGPDQRATMHDQGGVVVCTGNSVGTVTCGIYSPSGEVILHDVTVLASDFDWTLGDPI